MAEATFGEWLKRRRNAVGLTQAQLAVQLNCSLSALRKMEAELRRPSPEIVNRLAVIFEVPEAERTSFLRYARGDWTAMPGELPESEPWQPGQVSRAPRSNLPAPTTSFIGRERELQEIADLLGSHRLVTLTGVGGIGKTRLSLEVARMVLSTFPDGLWFLELAPLSDPALVPQAVVNTLGLIEQANRPPQTTLTDFLQAKKSLLILDNCEHLIEACAQLAEALLRACPDLHILATSREALGISGEWIHSLATLSIPDLQQSLTTASLNEYEAVQLFLDRAQMVAHDLVLRPENAPAITQICNHLDGIPLALELAAARLRGLSIEQVASRLNDRFHLLTSGARNVLPRHQTLRAMIDWSHDLLSEDERVLLRRLSVFAGGWTLEAAEAVCAGNDLETDQILDLLLRLVDKSLVMAEMHPAESRYHMLETIRQFTHEKLWQAGEGELMRQRQMAYFVNLAERAEPHLRAFGMIEWLDRLEVELDNFRVALEHALESDTEAQLRLASALLWFWHIRGRKSEGIEWLVRGLSIEAAERGNRPLTPRRAMIRGKALHIAGFLILMLFGPVERAKVLSEESQAIFLELGREGKRGQAYALFNLGYFRQPRGQAQRWMEASLALFQEVEDRFGMAECLDRLGLYACKAGDYALARVRWENQLELRKEIGDKDGIALALRELGYLAFRQGEYKQATRHYEASLELFREVKHQWAMSTVLAGLGATAQAQGAYGEAITVLEEAQVLGMNLGDKVAVADMLNELASVSRSQGNYEQAVRMNREALSLSHEVGNQFLIANALRDLGLSTLAEGNDQQARQHFEEVLAVSTDAKYRHGTASAYYGLGKVEQFQEGYTAASALYSKALMIFREISAPRGVAYCLEALAGLAYEENQMKRAIALFGMSVRFYAPLRFELSAKERSAHDQAISTARATYGEEAFTEAWEKGKAMTLEQAVAYALEGETD